MSQTKQITSYALHTFLEQIEEAILAGFKIHKTPATYAKFIGGRYTVTMVKAEEAVSSKETTSETGVVAEAAKPATTRKTTKKAGDSDE